MALYMEWENREGVTQYRQWHIGEPVPAYDGPVVKFQADMDELHCLLSAMWASCGADKRVIYSKQGGLQPKYTL